MGERVYVPQYKEPLDKDRITGAVIDEATVTQVVYVNSAHPNASDTNPGTDPEHPIRTLEDGLNTAIALLETLNAGVKLSIANGTYTTPPFEWTTFAGRFRRGLTINQKQNILIIEGESRGGVFIDCTEAIPPEEVVDLGGGLYGFPWTRNYGFSKELWPKTATEYGSAIAHRIESVFVNRKGLQQVILEPHELKPATFQKWIPIPDSYIGRDGVTEPGTFGVSEIEEDMIFFRPPEGVDMSTAEVRVGVGGPFFEVSEKSNLVIRNLVIFGPIQPYSAIHSVLSVSGASGARLENVLLEDIEIHQPSSGDSFRVQLADRVTMRRLIARGSGGNGFVGTQNANWIMEDLDFSENNWRSGLGGIKSWVVAGWKFFDVKDIVVNRYVSYDNDANGLWFDTDVTNVSVNELYAVGNTRAGFYNEKNFGEFLIENSVAMNNGRFGFYQAETGNTVIRDCISFNNGVGALGIRVRDYFTTDPEVTDQWLPQDIIVENNLFVGGDSLQDAYIYNYDGNGGRQNYLDTFVETFSGENNQYWSPVFPNAFVAESALDISAWLERVPAGEEASSIWADPGIDMTSDGVAHFYLYEETGVVNLGEVTQAPAFNQFTWNYVNARPLVDMPLNWRKDAVVEAHFILNTPEPGNYTFILNSNLDATLHVGRDDRITGVPNEADARSSGATLYRDWSDAGNGMASLDLEAGGFYHIVIRAVTPEAMEMPFLSLGWNAPWMDPTEIRPVAAPYIQSPRELPATLSDFLSPAGRNPDNSFTLEDFGTFWDFENAWLYHLVHYYLYVPRSQTLPGFWGYHGTFGWTYFNQGFGASWMYSQDFGSWIYAFGNFGGTSWYYVYTGPNQGYFLNP